MKDCEALANDNDYTPGPNTHGPSATPVKQKRKRRGGQKVSSAARKRALSSEHVESSDNDTDKEDEESQDSQPAPKRQKKGNKSKGKKKSGPSKSGKSVNPAKATSTIEEEDVGPLSMDDINEEFDALKSSDPDAFPKSPEHDSAASMLSSCNPFSVSY